MKKGVFAVLSVMLITLFVFIFLQRSTQAVSVSGGVFGGKIANTKAERIEELESDAYTCNVAGSTIEVTPINEAPYSYIIPSGIENKTGFSLRDGQWIIGKYSGTTVIECTNDDPEIPPQTVTLDTITLYGTSKM